MIPGRSIIVKFGDPDAAICTITRSPENPPSRKEPKIEAVRAAMASSNCSFPSTSTGVGLREVQIVAYQNGSRCGDGVSDGRFISSG